MTPQCETCCANCKYFEPSGNKDGMCRINPPRMEGTNAMWPWVKRKDWCGQFVALPPAVAVVVGQPSIED